MSEPADPLRFAIGNALWGATETAARCSHRPQHVLDKFIDANAAVCFAAHVIDGPLSDLNVLVQIPLVREFIQWIQYQEPIQETYLDHDGPFADWVNALEATR